MDCFIIRKITQNTILTCTDKHKPPCIYVFIVNLIDCFWIFWKCCQSIFSECEYSKRFSVFSNIKFRLSFVSKIKIINFFFLNLSKSPMIIAPIRFLIYIIEHNIKTSEAYGKFFTCSFFINILLEEQSDFPLNMFFYQ